MEIIHSIGTTLNGGGIGNTAYNEIFESVKKGYVKKIICEDYRQGEIPREIVKTIRLHKYLFRYPLRFIEKYLFKNFDSYFYIDGSFDWLASKKIEKCDIFHGWRNASKKQMIKARKLGAKTIITNASSHPLTQKRILEEEYNKLKIKEKTFTKKMLKRILWEINNADYILIPSDFVEQSFLENGFLKKKLIKIPFGVDLKKYSINKKRKDNKFRAIFVGQVTIRKGIHYLLEAWDELKLKNAELYIVGNIHKDAEKIVNKYKENKSIKFIGFDDPKKYYLSSDIFVFPSLEEGSALVTYEAMASGLPIIATFNTGSIARNKKEGFIIPIRDINAIKEKIKYFYKNPKEVQKMGKNARKLAEKYPWEDYSKKVMKVYEGIVNGK